MLHLSIHGLIVWIRHFTAMIRPLYLCFAEHMGLECESGRKKKACYQLRKETKLYHFLHFSTVKMSFYWKAFDRCTNPHCRQGTQRGTDHAFPIHFNSPFLWLFVGIEHNTKLAAKISCDSPDSFDHMMRNYWTEQQKSNDYIQKEETEKLHFGHRSMKAQQKCKKSKQARTSPEEQRLSGERTESALWTIFNFMGKVRIRVFCEDVTNLWLYYMRGHETGLG